MPPPFKVILSLPKTSSFGQPPLLPRSPLNARTVTPAKRKADSEQELQGATTQPLGLKANIHIQTCVCNHNGKQT